MEFQFENIEIIKDVKTFDSVRVYFEGILSFATTQGLLKHPDGDNEYSRELGRIGHLLAQYESDYQNFEPLRFKSPLILSIEKQMKEKALNQRQTAFLLDIKENTLSQMLTGKRHVSMKLAKRLYTTLKIDPKLIIEFA